MGWLSRRPPATASAGPMQGGIATNRCASGQFQALIRIGAWDNGDMRGWFQLDSDARAEPNPPTCRAFPKKRLMGFEPTTFCMAIGPVLQRIQHQNQPICRRFSNGAIGARRRRYARTCADMQRFGHFWPEVPETGRGGSNRRTHEWVSATGRSQTFTICRQPQSPMRFLGWRARVSCSACARASISAPSRPSSALPYQVPAQRSVTR